MLPVYHDVYIESVTHRKETIYGKMALYLSIVMAVLGFAMGFLIRGAFLLSFAFAALAFVVKGSLTRDYEINYTNGELEVDVIYSKSRRKNLITVNAEDIVVLAKSKTEPVQRYIGSRMQTFDCISHEEGVPYYCMIYKNRDRQTEEKLLFEPNEELLNELKRRLGGQVYI